MFSPGSAKKSQIQEANKHLQLLHSKIEELEHQLAETQVHFAEREKELSGALEFAQKSKDAQIGEVKQQTERLQVELEMTNEKLQQKDIVIARLQHKCETLDYITKHKYVLEEIVSVLSGVQRLDQKYQQKPEPIKDDTASCRDVMTELSRKTEAHGISESNSNGVVNNNGQPYRTFDGRFSISEIEEDEQNVGDLPDDVFSKPKSDKELYL